MAQVVTIQPFEDQDPLAAFEKAAAELSAAKKKRTLLFGALFAIALIGSGYIGEVSLPVLLEGLPGFFNYINETLPIIRSGSVVKDVGEWYWALDKWLLMLWDTVLIAFLATLFGALAAFILCFPASRNLMKHYGIYFLSRRLLEIARAVPELVYALIFVFSFGLGPLPGVLAIAIHSAGALGKLFSEVNENVDEKPIEGVRAAGGNWFQVIRYAVTPQVLPNFVSYAVLRFEINVRAASIIGFVGAGGIGQELMFVVRQFVYVDISAIVLLIIGAVVIIDLLCEQVRHRIIGKEALL